jgi:hypothetical protein
MENQVIVVRRGRPCKPKPDVKEEPVVKQRGRPRKIKPEADAIIEKEPKQTQSV